MHSITNMYTMFRTHKLTKKVIESFSIRVSLWKSTDSNRFRMNQMKLHSKHELISKNCIRFILWVSVSKLPVVQLNSSNLFKCIITSCISFYFTVLFFNVFFITIRLNILSFELSTLYLWLFQFNDDLKKKTIRFSSKILESRLTFLPRRPMNWVGTIFQSIKIRVFQNWRWKCSTHHFSSREITLMFFFGFH